MPLKVLSESLLNEHEATILQKTLNSILEPVIGIIVTDIISRG